MKEFTVASTFEKKKHKTSDTSGLARYTNCFQVVSLCAKCLVSLNVSFTEGRFFILKTKTPKFDSGERVGDPEKATLIPTNISVSNLSQETAAVKHDRQSHVNTPTQQTRGEKQVSCMDGK